MYIPPFVFLRIICTESIRYTYYNVQIDIQLTPIDSRTRRGAARYTER